MKRQNNEKHENIKNPGLMSAIDRFFNRIKRKTPRILDSIIALNLPFDYYKPEPDIIFDGKYKYRYPSYDPYEDMKQSYDYKRNDLYYRRPKNSSVEFTKEEINRIRKEQLKNKARILFGKKPGKYDKEIIRHLDYYNNLYKDKVEKWKKEDKRYNAKYEKLNPGIIKAIIEIESKNNPYARNRDTGAIGLMQLMPGSIEILNKEYGFNIGKPGTPDITNPEMNIKAGIQWLMRKLYEEDTADLISKGKTREERLRRMLKAFHGWDNIPIEENPYVKAVMEKYNNYK